MVEVHDWRLATWPLAVGHWPMANGQWPYNYFSLVYEYNVLASWLTVHEDPYMRYRLSNLPGITAALTVSAVSLAIGRAEEIGVGRAIIEPLVAAILIGMIVRTVRGERPREDAGVRFVAKDVLEFAVCLLGATMDVPRLFASGPMLAVGIVLLVCTALAGG